MKRQEQIRQDAIVAAKQQAELDKEKVNNLLMAQNQAVAEDIFLQQDFSNPPPTHTEDQTDVSKPPITPDREAAEFVSPVSGRPVPTIVHLDGEYATEISVTGVSPTLQRAALGASPDNTDIPANTDIPSFSGGVEAVIPATDEQINESFDEANSSESEPINPLDMSTSSKTDEIDENDPNKTLDTTFKADTHSLDEYRKNDTPGPYDNADPTKIMKNLVAGTKIKGGAPKKRTLPKKASVGKKASDTRETLKRKASPTQSLKDKAKKIGDTLKNPLTKNTKSSKNSQKPP